MHIIYSHRTQGIGVEGVHINSIISSFFKLGHQVTVVCPSGVQYKVEETDNSSDIKSEVNTKFFTKISKNFPEFLFELSEIIYNLFAVYRLIKIKPRRVDLIYERYAIFLVAGSLISFLYRRPLLLEINYTAKSPLVRKRTSLLKPLAICCDRWIFCRAKKFVVVSSYLKNHLITEYGIDGDKIKILPNAADPDIFSKNIKPVSEIKGRFITSERVIGFVGGFYPWHGLDLLIDALSKIIRKVPNVVLLLIGHGPERSNIEKKVQEKGLSDSVIFAGTIFHKELPRYIARFDIGVMPDSNEYGSPMKIFEYMSAGKPVVVPDYGPLVDVIHPEDQGIIFKKRDVDSLSEALLVLLTDENKLEEMGYRARKYIIQEQNWLNNARRSIEFIGDNIL